MLPKRIAIKILGVWTLLVVLVTMAWQVSPALAGFTPTPTVELPTATSTATATAVPPTATATSTAAVVATATATSTATAGLPTATAGLPTTTATAAPTQPTQSTPENTPEMPVTGGQASGLSNGMGTVLLLGAMALLILVTILVTYQVDKTKTKV